MRHTSRMHANDRRNQLLESALEVFSRRGFEGATTKEIAAAANVTEAVIFRHFPNKQSLYEAVLQHRVQCAPTQQWLDEAKAVMERGDDEGLFRLIARTVISSYRNDPRGQKLTLFAALEGHEPGLAHYRAVTAPIFEFLRDYMERRQKEGALADIPVGAILLAISGMATQFALMTQMFGFACDVPDDVMAEAFTQIMIRGAKPAPARA
jgi:AcrR family transcriptional regulator